MIFGDSQVDLFSEFNRRIEFDPFVQLEQKKMEQLGVDFFDFYNAVSSVYSSKIEGENIEFDSFYKHKFLNVPFQPDYTKRGDDLYLAYEFIFENELSIANIQKAHKILSDHFLPENQQGQFRNNPMYVLNNEDRIEYVACSVAQLPSALKDFESKMEGLLAEDLSPAKVFYYASWLHLYFVKIHPFQDGNGRTARLIEKWFLKEKIGEKAIAIELEKNYYLNQEDYYKNIKRLGLEFDHLNYSNALPFLLMTISSMGPVTTNE